MTSATDQIITQAVPVSPLENPSRTLSNLRSRVLVLGIAWVLLGVISGVMTAAWLSITSRGTAPVMIPFLVVGGFFTAYWMTVGIGALARKRWSIRGGLAFGYVALVPWVLLWFAETLSPQSSGVPEMLAIILQFAIIRQAHRVLRWHRELGEQSPLR